MTLCVETDSLFVLIRQIAVLTHTVGCQYIGMIVLHCKLLCALAYLFGAGRLLEKDEQCEA